MKKILWTLFLLSLLSTPSLSQSKELDIISIVDGLRVLWDAEANKIEHYEGMKTYCHSKGYRKQIIQLLKQIHHYDTALYFVVSAKYDITQNLTAKETLSDITVIETKYTNLNFISFLKEECKKIIHIEKKLTKEDSGGFERDIESLEEELMLYIDAITERIDLVDEHIHHLKGFDPHELIETETTSGVDGF